MDAGKLQVYIEDILDKYNEQVTGLDDCFDYIQSVILYNVSDGKANRFRVVAKTISASRERNEQGDSVAILMGCLCEIFHAYMLITDDIIDESVLRRDKPCWYKKVGLSAINDALLLNCLSLEFLKYNTTREQFELFAQLINKMVLATVYGQMLDIKHGLAELAQYSKDTLVSIYTFKASYYTFIYPVMFGLLINNDLDKVDWRQFEQILKDIGIFYQMQDDFMDCFGDPLITGKNGTDIENGKLCLPVVMAADACTGPQWKCLADNYGKFNYDKVNKVKSLYEQLGIGEAGRKYLDDYESQIRKQIDLTGAQYKPVLGAILSKISNRQK